MNLVNIIQHQINLKVTLKIFPKLLSLLTPRVNLKQNCNDQEKKISKYTDFILNWHTGIYHQNCLRRSLVLYYFFRKFGINVQIYWGTRFYMSKQQKHLDGHAWLVLNGYPFADRREDPVNHYNVTYRYPE